MKRYENDCVNCDNCIECGRKHSPHYYCDKCKDEFYPNQLYDFDGEMLCEECLLKQFKTIEEKS